MRCRNNAERFAFISRKLIQFFNYDECPRLFSRNWVRRFVRRSTSTFLACRIFVCSTYEFIEVESSITVLTDDFALHTRSIFHLRSLDRNVEIVRTKTAKPYRVSSSRSWIIHDDRQIQTHELVADACHCRLLFDSFGSSSRDVQLYVFRTLLFYEHICGTNPSKQWSEYSNLVNSKLPRHSQLKSLIRRLFFDVW